MNTHISHTASLALVALTLSACATTGVGTGHTRKDDITAAFQWKANDDRSGILSANLSNGEEYTGKFFQITSETRVEDVAPLWAGWHVGWRGWDYWDRMPSASFVTHYSGKVVANLDGPNEEHMRCRFTLIRPDAGMAGGGEGRCQLPSGRNIDATFPRA